MTDRRNTDENEKSTGTKKKPFVEPEMKEFDDLEKQIKGGQGSLIGTFTP